MGGESAYYAALQASGGEVLLDGPGNFPFTVFAPSNEAFGKLQARGYGFLVDAVNKNKLRRFSVLSSRDYTESLKTVSALYSLNSAFAVKIAPEPPRVRSQYPYHIGRPVDRLYPV